MHDGRLPPGPVGTARTRDAAHGRDAAWPVSRPYRVKRSQLDPTELRILIDRRHALTIRVKSAQGNEIELAQGWKAISVGWNKPPEPFDIELWIDACLPENGNREPYTTRAATMMVEHGVRGTIGFAATAWANPDAEYPGAVTFESVPPPRREPPPGLGRPTLRRHDRVRTHAPANLRRAQVAHLGTLPIAMTPYMDYM